MYSQLLDPYLSSALALFHSAGLILVGGVNDFRLVHMLLHMQIFQVHLEVKGDLHLSEEFTLDSYRFIPGPEGFSIIFGIDAPSTEVAKTASASEAQLLVDCFTFAKGPSLQYHVRQITQVPGKEPGSQVATGQAFSTARAHIVVTEGRSGISPVVDLTKRVTGHDKAEVLGRVLRWYARGASDIDGVDKFVDYWVALEALADSYEGQVEAHNCQNCGHTINPRPVSGILRAYLRSLGMSEAADRVSTLQDARSELVHEASTRALEHLAEAQGILKNCIQRELD